MDLTQKAPGSKRKKGRPPSLTLKSVVDAACEIGLARLDMGLVAERLNTGVATLYTYVSGREQLLQLVSHRLAGDALIRDSNQSWEDLLREHGAVTSAVFEALPHLITNLISGAHDEKPSEYSLTLLAMLIDRGFSQEEAIRLYIETTQVVIGAAVCLQRRKSLGGVTSDPAGRPVPLPPAFGDYKPTLERVIDSEQRKRA